MRRTVAYIILLSILICILQQYMLNNMSVLKISDIDNSIEEIRNFKFDSDGLSKLFDFAGENDFDTYDQMQMQ